MRKASEILIQKVTCKKWNHDFEKMFNMQAQASFGNDQVSNWVIYMKIKATQMTAIFVVQSEVHQAVLHLKVNKASWVDEVPGEVLKKCQNNCISA